MSIGVSGFSAKTRSQDFDLNITSIIDSFTVLIAFMLASASFLSVSVFDAGVSSAGAVTNDKTPPAVNVELVLGPDQSVLIKLSGKVTSSTAVSARGGQVDFDSLAAQLGAVKAKFPDVSAATLVADNRVEYRNIIKTMEVTRKTLPYVMLGGF